MSAHLILLDLITLITSSGAYKLWNSLCSVLQPPFTSYLLGPNILFSTLNLYSYLSVRDQVSHQYKNNR